VFDGKKSAATPGPSVILRAIMLKYKYKKLFTKDD
jgi:hypothetical protein